MLIVYFDFLNISPKFDLSNLGLDLYLSRDNKNFVFIIPLR